MLILRCIAASILCSVFSKGLVTIFPMYSVILCRSVPSKHRNERKHKALSFVFERRCLRIRYTLKCPLQPESTPPTTDYPRDSRTPVIPKENMKTNQRCCRCGHQKPGASLLKMCWMCNHAFCRTCFRLPSQFDLLEGHVSNVIREDKNEGIKKRNEHKVTGRY